MAFWPPPRLLAAQTERSIGPTSPRLPAPGSWWSGLAKATQKPFAILTLESREASYEAMLFNREYEALKQSAPEALTQGSIVFIEGEADHPVDDEGNPMPLRLRINRITPVAKVPELYTGMINIYIDEADATPEKVRNLAELCAGNPGNAKVQLCLKTAAGDCIFMRAEHLKVTPVPQFLDAIHALFGANSTKLKADRVRPEPRQRNNFRRHAPAPPPADD